MTVAELISILQRLDPNALVVAPFSPNPSDINVEEVGGAFTRKTTPYENGIELARVYDSRAEYKAEGKAEGKAPSNPSRVSKEEMENIRLADTDAPV